MKPAKERETITNLLIGYMESEGGEKSAFFSTKKERYLSTKEMIAMLKEDHPDAQAFIEDVYGAAARSVMLLARKEERRPSPKPSTTSFTF